jgi:molybdenum cofactor cytidylyltransferase
LQQNGSQFVAIPGLRTMTELPALILIAEPASIRHDAGEDGALKFFSTLVSMINRVRDCGLPTLLICDEEGARTAHGFLPEDRIARTVFHASAAADQRVEALVTGIQVEPNAGGWLALPCAVPMLKPETIRQVANGLQSHPVAYAEYRQRQGYPLGFSPELFSELVKAGSFRDLERVIARYPAIRVEVDDPGVLLTPDGLKGGPAYFDRRSAGLPVPSPSLPRTRPG